nr:hypothetical protein [Segatella oris]
MFTQDIQLVHGLTVKKENILMAIWGIMLGVHIECINELFKKKADLVHS